jgi:hypothetical protein
MARLIAIAAVLLACTRDVSAYSVLAHEANVDALWDSHIRRLLVQRFPRTSRDDLLHARAYAYGGSVMQDLGYYPFGNHFFSNLVHYVRSGDFVTTLIRDARDVNEYAFALGALAHYTADNTGHPEAVNRAVPIEYPKLRRKFGDRVTYVQSPTRHVIVEFSFDVVQAAAGAYVPYAYHAFIGFEVAKPLLERAFRQTYGLDMKDVFGDEDLAIATYRYSVSQLLPELTRTAVKTNKDLVVYRYTRVQFEKEFGTGYRRPGFFARFIAFVYRIVPKIGPLSTLSFKAPTAESEALFTASFRDASARYARALDQVRGGRLALANANLDIGRVARRGEYSLADKTADELRQRLERARH